MILMNFEFLSRGIIDFTHGKFNVTTQIGLLYAFCHRTMQTQIVHFNAVQDHAFALSP